MAKMVRGKKYIVWLGYRLTRQRRSENPRIKDLITEIETWDTILPFSAKDHEDARKTASAFTDRDVKRTGAAEISVEGVWEVKRRIL